MFPFLWWSHWPVARIASDGRHAMAPDQAAHSSLSWVSQEAGAFLYGMTERSPADLLPMARVWIHPSPIRTGGDSSSIDGYDQDQRAYRFRRVLPGDTLEVELAGSAEAPVFNPALVIQGWGEGEAALRIDGRDVPRWPGLPVRPPAHARSDRPDRVDQARIRKAPPSHRIFREQEGTMMRRTSHLILAVLLLLPLARTGAGEAELTREQRLGWWRQARFGMFIHWGLYAIPAGVWKDKVHKTGYSEWIMFAERIPAKEYELLAKGFNPLKFDAKAWAAIARKAGMRYMVLTTKHHDGFSMFGSNLTTYDIVDATPFKRDVTKELSEACRDSGLRFGCYYSIDRDWYRPQGPGNHYKQNNVWDYPGSVKEDFDRYFETFAKPQVEELLTRYRPDLLWFDEIDMKTDAQVEDLYRTIRKLRPECVVNSRIKTCGFPDRIPPPHCDYISSGDNEIAEKAPGFDWENPGTMNTSYGYNRNDHDWVEAKEIVFRLVDIVSKGGNYLLNVGPTSDGLIPQPSVDRLMEVGAWMETNHEAIYGTSQWRVVRDGPPGKEGTGAQETGPEARTDIRFTEKGDSVYAICLAWPDRELLVRALGDRGVPDRAVAAVRMLGSKEAVTWRRTDDGLTLSVPREKPCRHAYVYRIDLK